MKDYANLNVYQLNDQTGPNAHFCYQIGTNKHITYRLIVIYSGEAHFVSERVSQKKESLLRDSHMKPALLFFLHVISRTKKEATSAMIQL